MTWVWTAPGGQGRGEGAVGMERSGWIHGVVWRWGQQDLSGPDECLGGSQFLAGASGEWSHC